MNNNYCQNCRYWRGADTEPNTISKGRCVLMSDNVDDEDEEEKIFIKDDDLPVIGLFSELKLPVLRRVFFVPSNFCCSLYKRYF